MASSVEGLAAALETAAAAGDRTPRDLAAAAIGLGYLGRALVVTATHDERTRRGAEFDDMARRLGQACAELGASAPLAESRTTMLAAAMADSIGRLLPSASAMERRVLISRTVDSLTPLLEILAELPPEGEPRERFAGIELLVDQVQHEASRMRLGREAHWILHRDIAPMPDPAQPRNPVELPTAMGVLLSLTTTGTTMSASDVLQVSIACEVVARAGQAPRGSGAALLPKDVTAADGWLAVQATLAAIRERSGATTKASPYLSTAALMVARTAMEASPNQLAAAAQQLPEIADDLHAAAGRWNREMLDPRTAPLPGQGRAPASLEQAVARVSRALDAAGTLSVLHADEVGHHTSAAGWTQHHEQAHGRDFRDAAGEAQAVVCNYVRPNFLALTSSSDAAAGSRATVTPPQQKGAPAMTPRRPEDALPSGYKIAESGVPSAPTKYQVLYGSGRAQQFIGMREERGEAVQLAYQHHSRLEAQRSAALRAPSPQPPGPRR